jgi:hypothetical protein
MPQQQDLHVLGRSTAGEQPKPAKHPNGDHVEQSKQHGPRSWHDHGRRRKSQLTGQVTAAGLSNYGHGEEWAEGPSRVTFDIEPYGDIVRLTVTHENIAEQAEYDAVSAGWPAVLANFKSLMETGHVLPQAPWEMHAELRAARMAQNEPR